MLASTMAAVAGLGEQLKEWRERAGLSQEAVARRLGHQRPGTVQSWEKGRRKPKPANIKRLADILGASASEQDAALSALVGVDASRPPPRAAPRVAAPAVDPLVAGFAEALDRGADRAIALALANTLRSLAHLPALAPGAAPRRARAR